MSDRRKKQAVTVLICGATVVALGAAAQIAGPVASTSTAVSSAAANLLGNGSFENALSGWSNWGNASVVTGQASSGSYALRVGTAAGGAGYSVTGIVAGTTYVLTAQVKVSNASDTGFVGVNFLDASSSGKGRHP